jgi:hypothetical protein
VTCDEDDAQSEASNRVQVAKNERASNRPSNYDLDRTRTASFKTLQKQPKRSQDYAKIENENTIADPSQSFRLEDEDQDQIRTFIAREVEKHRINQTETT